MVVSMIGRANLSNPAMNYTPVSTPVLKCQIFFDTFEECSKLPILFFDIVDLLRW